MIFLTLFVASWILFSFFVERTRIGELLPSMIFAGFLGIFTDILMLEYQIWDYHKFYPLSDWMVAILLDLGIYAVVAGLYIQWLPKKPTLQVAYTFVWTTGTIFFEYCFIQLKWMEYHQWWNIGDSYLSDWIIFYLIILQYEFFRKLKLTQNDKA